MISDWTIQETVVSLLSDLGTISVVRLGGGNYALAVNGECIRAIFWHAGQLDECIAAAMRMAGRDVHKLRERSPVPDAPTRAHS